MPQKILKAEDRIRKFAALTGVMLMAAAEAFAQEGISQQNAAQPGIAAPARRIVISISDHKLALVESGRVVKVYATAVGAQSTPSPTGSYKVVQRLMNPTWYGKGKIVPPGKLCPIGTRWIGLSARGYGIHGTNNPASIGHNASHGCIRMQNRDVEQLFEMVSIGDTVDLYNQRTPELDRIFGPTGAQIKLSPAVAKQIGTVAVQ